MNKRRLSILSPDTYELFLELEVHGSGVSEDEHDSHPNVTMHQHSQGHRHEGWQGRVPNAMCKICPTNFLEILPVLCFKYEW